MGAACAVNVTARCSDHSRFKLPCPSFPKLNQPSPPRLSVVSCSLRLQGANMRCVITYTSSTEREDFYGEGADAKLLDFSAGVGLDVLFDPEANPLPEILTNLRDAKP